MDMVHRSIQLQNKVTLAHSFSFPFLRIFCLCFSVHRLALGRQDCGLGLDCRELVANISFTLCDRY